MSINHVSNLLLKIRAESRRFRAETGAHLRMTEGDEAIMLDAAECIESLRSSARSKIERAFREGYSAGFGDATEQALQESDTWGENRAWADSEASRA